MVEVLTIAPYPCMWGRELSEPGHGWKPLSESSQCLAGIFGGPSCSISEAPTSISSDGWLVLTVSMPQPRLNREENLKEGLSRSCWPLGMSLRDYFDWLLKDCTLDYVRLNNASQGEAAPSTHIFSCLFLTAEVMC